MGLEIQKSIDGNFVILDLKGDVTYGDANQILRRSVRDSLEDGYRDIRLDLEEVEYVDSSGVGELISSLMATNRLDGRLILSNIPDKVHQLLAISRLTDIFEIHS